MPGIQAALHTIRYMLVLVQFAFDGPFGVMVRGGIGVPGRPGGRLIISLWSVCTA